MYRQFDDLESYRYSNCKILLRFNKWYLRYRQMEGVVSRSITRPFKVIFFFFSSNSVLFGTYWSVVSPYRRDSLNRTYLISRSSVIFSSRSFILF